MGNMNTSDDKFRIKDILILILFLLLLAIPIYFAYTILFPRVEIFDQEEEQNTEQDIEQDEDEELENERERMHTLQYPRE